jgi:hypothetical protein
MDLKKAIKTLKTLDEIAFANPDVLEEHNGQYILSMNDLAIVDSSLAEVYEELELAAPWLFLTEVGMRPAAEKAIKAAQLEVKRCTSEDHPFLYYILCSNFVFGIGSL